MPSPVLIAALVVNGKTRPPPPVHMITERARIAWISPVRISIAMTPWQRPFSTSRRVANHSS